MEELKEALEKRLEDNGSEVTISFPVYNDNQLNEGERVTSISLTEEDIQSAIEKLEANISYLEEYIAITLSASWNIKKLEDGTYNIEDLIERTKQEVENEIAFKEEQIKNAKERFDALNKAKDALITEFAGSAE